MDEVRKEKKAGKVREGKRDFFAGILLLVVFVLWTAVIRFADARAIGPEGSRVGLAAFNGWFHSLTGVSWGLYTVTDWLGLVPIAVCLGFAGLGAVQLFRRKGFLRVDADILLLGAYYLLVIFFYLFFEAVPVNYRPVLIDGYLEASYPSSTTLLVLSVMPTLKFEADRRFPPAARKAAGVFAALFSAFMAGGRLVSGVHWATDVIGAAPLSTGLFLLFRSVVSRAEGTKEKTAREGAGRA